MTCEVYSQIMLLIAIGIIDHFWTPLLTMSTVTSPTFVFPCLLRNSFTVFWNSGTKLAMTSLRFYKVKHCKYDTG